MTGTHQIPYAEFPALKFDFQILMKASAGLRPSIPDPLPDEVTLRKDKEEGKRKGKGKEKGKEKEKERRNFISDHFFLFR